MPVRRARGTFRRESNGRLSFQVPTPYDDVFFDVVFRVGEKYNFTYHFEFLAHQCYATLERDGLTIWIGWHESCGIYVEPASEAGNHVVREIGRYLNDVLDELKWELPLTRTSAVAGDD